MSWHPEFLKEARRYHKMMFFFLDKNTLLDKNLSLHIMKSDTNLEDICHRLK